MTITLGRLLDKLAECGGTLATGVHDDPSCGVCALELVSVCQLGEITDSPEATGYPDIRDINDSYLSDQRRTDALLPWIVALDGWSEWSSDRQQRWAEIVTLRTIREILPSALRAVGLSGHAAACERAEDIATAKSAASDAARSAAAASAAYAAARAAARAAAVAAAAASAAFAAADAARAATYAAGAAYDVIHEERTDDLLDLAVQIQIDAAQTTKEPTQ